MKWAYLAFLLVLVPVLVAWLRNSPRQAPWLWTLLTFLPFVNGPWNLVIAPYSTPIWSGFVKGWEVGLLDAVSLAVCLGTRGRWPRLLGIMPLLVYLFLVLIACWQAPFYSIAFSYVVQLTRVSILVLAVARVASLEQGDRALIRGLALGLLIQSLYAIMAKLGGAVQTGGSLGHQNLLGFVSHMALMPVFAAFLAGRWTRVTIAGTIGGLICVALTASRGTIVLSGIGLVLTLALTMMSGFSGRKAMIGLAGTLMLAASIPLVQANLEQRYADRGRQGLLEVDSERDAFNNAALTMLSDHPLGVGPNHYVFIANTDGYNDRAGVYWGIGSRGTSVHNSYLLIAAETGYLGIASFCFVLLVSIWSAFRGALRFRKLPGSELMLGCGVAIIVTSVHAMYEWMYVIEPSQYLFGGTLGLIAGLSTKLARQSAIATSPRQMTGAQLPEAMGTRPSATLA